MNTSQVLNRFRVTNDLNLTKALCKQIVAEQGDFFERAELNPLNRLRYQNQLQAGTVKNTMEKLNDSASKMVDKRVEEYKEKMKPGHPQYSQTINEFYSVYHGSEAELCASIRKQINDAVEAELTGPNYDSTAPGLVKRPARNQTYEMQMTAPELLLGSKTITTMNQANRLKAWTDLVKDKWAAEGYGDIIPETGISESDIQLLHEFRKQYPSMD